MRRGRIVKRNNILGLSGVLILIALALGIRTSARPQAGVGKLTDVEQGSTLALQVTTDTPASVAGTVTVEVMPPGAGLPVSSTSGSFSGKSVNVNVTIPLDAMTGSWRVMRVTFHSSAGGPDKDLTPDGSLTFRVTPHAPLVLPSHASIAIQ
jgi:hypothetical protein